MESLPATSVKDGARRLATPLTHLINLTIHIGVILDDLKMVGVVLVSLFKSN